MAAEESGKTPEQQVEGLKNRLQALNKRQGFLHKRFESLEQWDNEGPSCGRIGSETEELWEKCSEDSIADMEGLPISPHKSKEKNVDHPNAVNVPPSHRAGQHVKAVKPRQIETRQPPMEQLKDKRESRRREEINLPFESFLHRIAIADFSGFVPQSCSKIRESCPPKLALNDSDRLDFPNLDFLSDFASMSCTASPRKSICEINTEFDGVENFDFSDFGFDFLQPPSTKARISRTFTFPQADFSGLTTSLDLDSYLHTKKNDPAMLTPVSPFNFDVENLRELKHAFRKPLNKLETVKSSADLKKSYRKQRGSVRAATCIDSVREISRSLCAAVPEFRLQTLQERATTMSTTNNGSEAGKPIIGRHQRAFTFQLELSDPDLTSAYQILSMDPQQTLRTNVKNMEQCPHIIDYTMSISDSDEEGDFEQNDGSMDGSGVIRQIPSISPQNILKDDNERQSQLKYRKRMINELCATEDSFLRQMVELFICYGEPLRTIISSERHKTLFPPCLMLIQVFTAKLLEDLQTFKNNYDDEACLSGILEEYISQISETFSEYSCVYNDIQTMALKLAKKQKTRSVFDAHKSADRLSFFSLAIVPVQRPSRYLLLIKGILDTTPHDHPDYEGLIEIKRLLASQNTEINENLRSHSERRKVEHASRKLRRSNLNDRQSRLLLKRGNVTLINDNYKKKREVVEIYLFNDLLLSGAFVSKFANIFGSSEKFVNKTEMLIDSSFRAISMPDVHQKRPPLENVICIQSQNKSMFIECDTQRDKKDWLSAFETATGDFGKRFGDVKYNGPWCPIEMPYWWTKSCTGCESDLRGFFGRTTIRCDQCGSLVCTECFDDDFICISCSQFLYHSHDSKNYGGSSLNFTKLKGGEEEIKPATIGQVKIGDYVRMIGMSGNEKLEIIAKASEDSFKVKYFNGDIITAKSYKLLPIHSSSSSSPALPSSISVDSTFSVVNSTEQDKGEADSHIVIEVQADVWGYNKNVPIPQKRNIKHRKIGRNKAKKGFPDLKDIQQTILTKSVSRFSRSASANNIIAKMFAKFCVNLNLDVENYGLELLDFPRQCIIGDISLKEYTVLKNFNQNLHVCIRDRTNLLWHKHALRLNGNNTIPFDVVE